MEQILLSINDSLFLIFDNKANALEKVFEAKN